MHSNRATPRVTTHGCAGELNVENGPECLLGLLVLLWPADGDAYPGLVRMEGAGNLDTLCSESGSNFVAWTPTVEESGHKFLLLALLNIAIQCFYR